MYSYPSILIFLIETYSTVQANLNNKKNLKDKKIVISLLIKVSFQIINNTFCQTYSTYNRAEKKDSHLYLIFNCKDISSFNQ